MDFRYTAEEEAFHKEVKEFLDKELPPGFLGIDPGPEEESRPEIFEIAVKMWRKFGERNWIGITWPKEYGGQGGTIWKEMVLLQELAYRGSPGMDLAIAQGEIILHFGTEEQKKKFVLPITKGEVKWAIGMSEPNAGTDTFNVQLKAVEEADCFVLNGQKIWTSGAHNAKWCMVYARTDANKHLGLSVFIVDLKSPGITMRRITQATGIPAFCEVFFDNVRVPKENLLGKKNGGWEILLFAFGAERTYGLFTIYNGKRYLEHLIQYCKETKDADGVPLAKDPIIRNRLAQLAIEMEVGMNMGHELNWMASKGMPTVKASSQIKVHGGAWCQRLANAGQQILGLYGPLNEDSKWVRLGGRIRHTYISSLSFTLAGGTTETTKNHIAGRFGLGLPKQV
ncbi:MAG: acyl-CoA dehydrogenase family protein [Dehalococcoidia bacterium]|nr:acyl-CoA dehydrogenase family protein [Dehalococcoidia bacterium]